MDVAARLYKIKNFKLYRLEFNTFEEYVEEKFNYSRGRAYQLTRAHEIAEYVNKNIDDKNGLTTEPQCRALLRLKKYKSYDVEDIDASNVARLELIKKLIKDDDLTVTTNDITKAVDEQMNEKTAKQDRLNVKKPGEYKSAINYSTKVIEDNITELLNLGDKSNEEMENIKREAMARLEQLIKKLK